MKKAKERYFGDTNTFAIRYVPGYTTENRQYFYAYCHLVLHGQIIGDENEPCFLNLWLHSFEGLKDRVKSNSDSLKHPAFANRSDREIFELIIKANQSPEQYWKRYDYLPALDNQVWRNCTISIDETTDAFFLAWAKAGKSIKFLWKGRGLPCPPTILVNSIPLWQPWNWWLKVWKVVCARSRRRWIIEGTRHKSTNWNKASYQKN